MKLSYIWVEEYKGFTNQGFNLGSEYYYNYSAESGLLTREKNKNYIESFFGEDIIDIKGIIGKNASGKTNILELVQYIVEGANTIINKPFFVVVDNDESSIVYTCKIQDIEYRHKVTIRPYQGKLPDFDSVFFSNVFDGRRHNFGKKIINISTNDLLQSQFGENINKNYQKSIQKQIKFLKSKEFRLLEQLEDSVDKTVAHKLKPSKVVLTSPIWSNIMSRAKSFEGRYNKLTGNTIELKTFISSFRRKITDNKSGNSIKYLTAFLVFIDFIYNRDVIKYEGNIDLSSNKRYKDILKDLFLPINEDYRIDEIFHYLTTDFAKIISQYWNVKETSKFLSELTDINLGRQNIEFKEDIGAYSNRRVQFNLNYNENVGTFITGYLNAITNQSLSYGIEWAGISSGHKAYINLFSNFYASIPKIKEKELLISIDEGDLYFHPKWQTEFLFKIINILPQLLNRKCQIYLTTHSPFLVSDLPKSNLLFVDKRDNEKLIVMDNQELEIETFGGNIGELYLDAFFMHGKLISHFAASKIQAIINKIRQKEKITEQDYKVIAVIGDELIKTQLNNLLHDKN